MRLLQDKGIRKTTPPITSKGTQLKKQLLIIGGGFAGFWSAISAIRQSREIQKRGEVDITLINPDNHVTIRSGINELPSDILRFDLDKYLKPMGVHQVIGRAEIINPEINEVIVSTSQGIRTIIYDYLILATGASLEVPNIPGISHTFNIDSFSNSQRLEDHIIELSNKGFQEEGASTFVVVGSGFNGLEIVIGMEQKVTTIHSYNPLKETSFRIILLEGKKQIATQYSPDYRKYINDVLASKNIEVISNTQLCIIGPASVLLDNNIRISTRTVIWTEGIVASPLTHFFKGVKDANNRLSVDRYLKSAVYDNIIAAGNVAHCPGEADQSPFTDCQYAQLEGRWAGHNAINDLFGYPLKEYIQPGYFICADLGEPKSYYSSDWENGTQHKILKQREAENHLNSGTIYPWQDLEETLKASFPMFPTF
ncbi:MAG: FAD-dependent oxidoreductase [Chitinophagaceae bacterium]